ncbi:MAG: suppressor of fused domain protein [Clostridia bacterium]|nr:suppressor of fused domain protein [Clostridia bacterium]
MRLFGKQKKPPFLYTEKALDQYEAFVAAHFGAYDSVFHEAASQGIHLDIIVVPPTDEHPYYKLVTMGMGAYAMQVPKNLKKYEMERAELVFFLPPDWPIAPTRPEDCWPLLTLRALARMPLKEGAWLGSGHSVPLPATETATSFGGLLLLNAAGLEGELPELRIPGFGKINFYQLIPLYKEELQYKRQFGTQALLALWDAADDFSPILDTARKNYALSAKQF